MIETSLEVLALESAESSLLQDTNISPSNNSVIFFIGKIMFELFFGFAKIDFKDTTLFNNKKTTSNFEVVLRIF